MSEKSYVATTREFAESAGKWPVTSTGSSFERRAKAGWRASIPESITAQRMPWQESLNSCVAASAFVATRDRQTALTQGRLQVTDQSSVP